ncbi:MAG: archaetidylserine decarboxylase [Gemmatimonadota bacterium]|jgi:phosphatidylserine decarboxylase|nr:archaetidylserine decarboxylase [Gemmatimonadota bacterium]
MEAASEVSPDRPTAGWRLILAFLRLLPQRWMSRGFGRVADFPIAKPFRRTLLSTFARAVGINLSEVELPLEDYPTLNAFFVRQLRPGAREWPASQDALASPVDGVVGRFGVIRDGVAIQAKGHEYPVADLLGDAGEAERYRNGLFLTIYLSPRHYHRIHTPAPGAVPAAAYLPGTLLPVNAPAVMHIPGLFVRNERLVCYLDTPRGRIAVVAVGAYNVGRISAAFDPEWSGGSVTNRSRPPEPRRRYQPPVPVAAGREIMAFHLGSTVVLLFEPGVRLREGLTSGLEVKVGEQIAITG